MRISQHLHWLWEGHSLSSTNLVGLSYKFISLKCGDIEDTVIGEAACMGCCKCLIGIAQTIESAATGIIIVIPILL